MPKSELQKRIDGDLVGLAAGSALAGSSGGAGGGVDHGALVGLLDDDHPQYPNLIQAETITGNWTFNPSGAPFAIGASATGQLVTGLNADQIDGLDEPDLLLVDGSNALTGNLSVDPGITIDGVDLSAHAADANAHHNQVHDIVGSDHTLTASQFQLVGATAVDTLGLLTPVSDAISTPNAILKSDTNGNLILRRLSIADNLIYAGDPDTRLTFSTDLIQIFAGNAAFLTLQKKAQDLVRIGTGGGADVDIDFNSQAKMFGDDGSWHFGGITAPNAKVDITRTGEQLRLLYDGSNYTAFDVGASGTLDILAVGDIVLSPTGEDVLPLGSVGVDLGDYNRMWRTLFAAELYVETLVAQDVLATIGGRIMVAPTTKLIADVDGVQTTIDVEHNNLASGDFVLLKTAPGGAAQIEVMKITSGATVITGGYRYSVSRNQDGTGANSWVTGDAVANLGSAAGEGYIELTSTQTIHSHLGPNITIYSRTAATNWDDSNPTVSLGNLESFVDYAADEFGLAIGNDLTLTPTTGLKGLTADRTNGLRMFNTDIALYNGATQTVDIAADGNAWFGSNSSNKTLQVTTTGANAGDVEVGDYSAGNDGVIWDESASALKVRGELRLEGAGNALIRAYASGIFAEDASNNPSFALLNEDSISWNGETLNTRDVLIGDNSASKANIFFDASAGTFSLRGGTTTAVQINTSGEIEASSGSAKVQMKAAGVRFTSGGASPATVTNLEWYDPSNALDVSIRGVAYDQVTFPAYIELRVGDNGVGSGLETFRLSRGANATLSATLDLDSDLYVAGDIGAGTTSPQARIHALDGGTAGTPSALARNVGIFQNTSAGGNFVSIAIVGGNTTGRSIIDFGDNDDIDVGGIHYLHNTNDMFFVTNTSEKFRIGSNGNIGINGNSYGSGSGVVFVADAGTVPSTNPSGGHIVYSQSGALKGRGSSGTVTTIAAAEPHCAACGSDFVLEWQNDDKGDHLIVCMNCLTEELGERPWILKRGLVN